MPESALSQGSGHKREEWIAARQRELLPVPYFHVVFTLPSSLNKLAMYKSKAVYDSLFAAAWSTLNTFGHDPRHLGAQVGMISILHTLAPLEIQLIE